MAKATMKTIAIVVVLIVAVAFVYSRWNWIESKFTRASA